MTAPRIVRDMAERFWSKVAKTPGGCWEWTAALFKNSGYGKFRGGNGLTVYCHRLSWEMAFGPPGDRYVLHRCDNRRCVNPAHLFLGNHQANVDDMIAKGRAAWQADRSGFVAAVTEAARARVPKSHCMRGHPLSGSNLYLTPQRGRRECRICLREAGRRFKKRARACRA